MEGLKGIVFLSLMKLLKVLSCFMCMGNVAQSLWQVTVYRVTLLLSPWSLYVQPLQMF